MARSQKDDPRYADLQNVSNSPWNFCGENIDSMQNKLNEPCTPPGLSNENLYGNPNAFAANDVYMKTPYSRNNQTGDTAMNNNDNTPFNNMQNTQRVNNCQNYGNAMLNLGNGQIMRVFYDENNQQLMIPVSGRYELFNHNQGLCDVAPLQSQQPIPSHMFTLQNDYPINNVKTTQQNPLPNNFGNNNQTANVPTSSFLKEVLGNWEPNSTGTYSPFGQNYPLNHPDAPANLVQNQTPIPEPILPNIKPENSPKRNENIPLADTSNKKRIVAEVKPMRPSYSDVLAKNTKNNVLQDATKVSKASNNVDGKNNKKTSNLKPEKPVTSNKKHHTEENKLKQEGKRAPNTASSGSESGDINIEEIEKGMKTNKRNKNKSHNSTQQKWSAEEMTCDNKYIQQENNSQFVFIENNKTKPLKKEKKAHENKTKVSESISTEEDVKIDNEDNGTQSFNESQSDSTKSRKKKDRSINHKTPKQSQDKKKVTPNRWRRNKPGYFGVAVNYIEHYIEHWWAVTRKACAWFLYLVSDICGMSFHLSFDLCTSAFTQTYVSCQAVWRSSKDWFIRLADNKYLTYIDRKLGHTRFAFWRKLKWFKKEIDTDNGGDGSQLNSNIPMPTTGEEAMKRLLACKGKDPYSILGVSNACTDDEIKRYYRRQAFLVHPDKNQQPGAEEAFKILQHAFDIIGEPERRELYDKRAQESLHAEAAWTELSQLLAQLHDKMEFAHNTIRCTNCGCRHKRVLTERPCYAARYCAECNIRHSAKEGDIWAESSMLGLLVMYYACMDGAVYQITQWASCQKSNLKELRPDCHLVQYRIVLGNKAAAAADLNHRPSATQDTNLEEFLNNLYNKSGATSSTPNTKQPTADSGETKKRRNKKTKS